MACTYHVCSRFNTNWQALSFETHLLLELRPIGERLERGAMSLLPSRKYQPSQPDALGFEEHINLIDEDPGFH